MEKELQGKLNSRNIVLYFGAQWCKPCKEHLPTCERISKTKGFEFEYVCIHDERGENYDAVIEHFGISTVPYIYASHEGVVLHFPHSALERNLNSLIDSSSYDHKF